MPPPFDEEHAVARRAADSANRSSISRTAVADDSCRVQQSTEFEQSSCGLLLDANVFVVSWSSRSSLDVDVVDDLRRMRLFIEKFGPTWIKLDVDSVTSQIKFSLILSDCIAVEQLTCTCISGQFFGQGQIFFKSFFVSLVQHKASNSNCKKKND